MAKIMGQNQQRQARRDEETEKYRAAQAEWAISGRAKADLQVISLGALGLPILGTACFAMFIRCLF